MVVKPEARFRFGFTCPYRNCEAQDVTEYVMSAEWDLGATDPEQRLSIDGKATIVLNNDSGVFNPPGVGNQPVDPPFEARIAPGVPLDISYIYSDETEVILWTGYVVSWQYEASENQANIVTVIASQTFLEFDREGLDIPIIENANANEIITAIINANKFQPPFESAFFLDQSRLDQVGLGLPSEFVNLGTPSIDYKVFGYELSNVSTLRDALGQIALAEMGYIWIDRAGEISFLSYEDIILGSTATSIDMSEVKSPQYVFGSPHFNEVEIEYSPKFIVHNSVLIETTIEVEAGVKEVIELVPKFDDETDTVIIKEVTNLSYSPSSNITISLRDYDSNKVNVFINDGNIEDREIDVTIKADYYKTDSAVAVIETDSDSVLETFRKVSRRYSLGLLSTINEAKSLAQKMLLRYSSLKGYFKSILVTPRNEEFFELLTIGQQVEISNDRMGQVNTKHIVIGERGSWQPQYLEIEYSLDLSNRSNQFILDVSHLDEGRLA